MEDERDDARRVHSPSSSSQIHEEEDVEVVNDRQEGENRDLHQQQQQQQQAQGLLHRVGVYVCRVASGLRHDLTSYFLVLVTFWFFASMTMILGFYGSMDLPLGPNWSYLVQVNPLFVQSVKAQEMDGSTHGPMLYGFYETPPLDVAITWNETYDELVQSRYHKEWGYFLNEGSKVYILYSVKSPTSAPVSLVIAQGKESLVNWIEDPSYPNTTLSWNIIYGNGTIQQEIFASTIYYIALGNLNPEEVQVQLHFTMKASVYNTTQAYYKCSLSHRDCNLKLLPLRGNSAIITSPGPDQDMPNHEWYVKLSYSPRWVTYFVGSGVVTILIILVSRIFGMFDIMRRNRPSLQAQGTRSEEAPLLSQKEDDLSSWGSSYDSISPDDEELDKLQPKEVDRSLCVICFEAPRDCFFLPCGHCAACFTCGTRIVEEAGDCPICHRTMKKVRQIFNV